MTIQENFELKKFLQQEIADKKKIALLKSITGTLISITLFLLVLVVKAIEIKTDGTIVIVFIAVIALFYAISSICEYGDIVTDGKKKLEKLYKLWEPDISIKEAIQSLGLVELE